MSGKCLQNGWKMFAEWMEECLQNVCRMFTECIECLQNALWKMFAEFLDNDRHRLRLGWRYDCSGTGF